VGRDSGSCMALRADAGRAGRAPFVQTDRRPVILAGLRECSEKARCRECSITLTISRYEQQTGEQGQRARAGPTSVRMPESAGLAESRDLRSRVVRLSRLERETAGQSARALLPLGGSARCFSGRRLCQPRSPSPWSRVVKNSRTRRNDHGMTLPAYHLRSSPHIFRHVTAGRAVSIRHAVPWRLRPNEIGSEQ
jgi:hypothetical protein